MCMHIACIFIACICIAFRAAMSPGSTRDVGSDVDEHHTMYASAPRCRRRWRAKYTAGRGAARVRIPAQTQRTQTQGASTRSACVHRAIPHSASSASSPWSQEFFSFLPENPERMSSVCPQQPQAEIGLGPTDLWNTIRYAYDLLLSYCGPTETKSKSMISGISEGNTASSMKRCIP